MIQYIDPKLYHEYDNALVLFDKIKIGEIKLSDAENDQKMFKSLFGEIKKGKNKKKIKKANKHKTQY